MILEIQKYLGLDAENRRRGSGQIMRVLFCELFVSLTAKTMQKYLTKMGYECILKSYYTPEDLEEDHRIDRMISKDIRLLHPDFVMSVNFWPPISRVCHKERVKYISYSYDTPQAVPTNAVFDTNYIFLFDRAEAEKYQSAGMERVYHTTLATDVELWDSISANNEKYEITLIGSVYKSAFYTLMSGLDDYYRGYLRAVVAAQQKIYGYYMINELLEDKIDNINQCLNKVNPDLTVSVEQMSWAMGSYINYLDRVSLLRLLQNSGTVHFFTKELEEDDRSLLTGVNIHGKVEYESEMPKIFKESAINLNPTSRVIRSGIPQRVLDVLGCNSFLISSYQPEVAEWFESEEEIVMYDSYEDAMAKTDFYLNNPDLRAKIASRGYEKIKKYFTYEKIIGRMLEIAEINL